MEKTVQITIASTQFQVTESAYDTLRSYLDRLKAHFGDAQDGTEIMRDIESRIAEKFIDAKHKLVTEKDVTAVIAEIGDASAFSDGTEPEQHASEPKEKQGRKRLYRDIDNAYLGGVSSGIAAYFNIDPIWIRLAFLVSIFSGGAGIVLYLILWFLIPEAKSASQKLEMSGRPVNLDTIAGIVKDRFDEAEKSGVFARSAHAIDSILRRVLSSVGRVIGVLLSFGSFFAIIGASILLGIVMLNWSAPWNDIPHKESISPYLLTMALMAGYTAIIIPLVFIFSLGYRWMMRRTILTTSVGFGLMGIWALSLVGSGALATKIGGDYYAYTSNQPEYAEVVDEHVIPAFDTLSVQDMHVTLKSGPTYSVRIEGKRLDMAKATVLSATGTLSVSSVRRDGPCIFCRNSIPSVTVTAPEIETITIDSGIVSLDNVVANSVVASLQNSSLSGSLKGRNLALNLGSSHARLELTLDSLALDLRNSNASLAGSATTAKLKTRSSSVNAESLRIEDATLDAQSSHVEVDVRGTFNVENKGSSNVQNAGVSAGVSESADSNSN